MEFINKDLPTHYRFRDIITEDGVCLIFNIFHPVRETKCMYFVVPDWAVTKDGAIHTATRKRVHKDSLRRYCYPTKELAFSSYKKRKARQLMFAREAVEKAQTALKFAEGDVLESVNLCGDGSGFDDLLVMGRPDIIDSYIFD